MSDSTPDPAPFSELRVRGSHPLWRRFPARFHSLFELFRGPYPAVHAPRFGLLRFRSPLLSESRLFSLPPPTEMFQFGGFPPHGYGFTMRYRRITPVGFPIQISADHLVFANPRRFSQLITSFFGSQCLGIHPVLFSLNHSRIPPGETLACVSLSSLCGCLHPQPQMSYSLIAICGFQGTIRIRGDLRSQRSERSPQRPDRKEPESSVCPCVIPFSRPFSLFIFKALEKEPFKKQNDAGSVEIKGFEPLTPCLQGRCSPN